jgi:hypothetical protein
MIDGVTLNLGGTEYVVPPLNFKALKRLMPVIERFGQSGASLNDEQMDGIVEVVYAALVRNYPDFPRERLEEVIDLGNAATVLTAVLGASGFVAGNGKAGSGLTSMPSPLTSLQ